jgi:hypothetical protein
MGIAWTPEWWNIERSQEWSSFLGTQFWQDYACSVEFGSVKWYNIWFCPKTFGLSFKCRYIGGKPHFQTNPNIPYCVGYVSDFDPLCIISMYVCVYIYIIHIYIYTYSCEMSTALVPWCDTCDFNQMLACCIFPMCSRLEHLRRERGRGWALDARLVLKPFVSGKTLVLLRPIFVVEQGSFN